MDLLVYTAKRPLSFQKHSRVILSTHLNHLRWFNPWFDAQLVFFCFGEFPVSARSAPWTPPDLGSEMTESHINAGLVMAFCPPPPKKMHISNLRLGLKVKEKELLLSAPSSSAGKSVALPLPRSPGAFLFVFNYCYYVASQLILMLFFFVSSSVVQHSFMCRDAPAVRLHSADSDGKDCASCALLSLLCAPQLCATVSAAAAPSGQSHTNSLYRAPFLFGSLFRIGKTTGGKWGGGSENVQTQPHRPV